MDDSISTNLDGKRTKINISIQLHSQSTYILYSSQQMDCSFSTHMDRKRFIVRDITLSKNAYRLNSPQQIDDPFRAYLNEKRVKIKYSDSYLH